MAFHFLKRLLKPQNASGDGPFPFLPTLGLKKEYDIILVGGGIEAITIAYVLSKHYGQTRIAVIENADFYESPGEELLIPYPLRLETAPLFQLSQHVFKDFLKTSPTRIETRKQKFLNIVTTDSQMRFAVDQSDILASIHTPGWIIPPQEIHIHTPLMALPADTQGALLYPDALSLDRRALYFSCASQARALGVTFINKCKVLEVCTQENHITGVETSQGFIAGKRVIATADLPCLSSYYPALTLKTCCEMNSLPINARFKPAVFSLKDTMQILYSSKNTFNIRDFSDNNSLAVAAHKTLRLLPQLSQHSIRTHRILHTRTASDGLPVIGKTPVEGLYVHLGLGWNRYSFALGAAAAMASSVVSRSLHSSLQPFIRKKDA